MVVEEVDRQVALCESTLIESAEPEHVNLWRQRREALLDGPAHHILQPMCLVSGLSLIHI